MSRIFWDTHLFLYLLEDTPGLGARVAALRRRMLERQDQLFTSALTLGEALAGPTERGDEPLRAAYAHAIRSGAVILPLDERAGRRLADIRAGGSIAPADAIQLACASEAGVDLFVTSDERLSDMVIPGVQFITSLERARL